MPYINGLIVQSDGSRPHVVYIMETLAKTFPNVIWKIGGKVQRTTWGGGFSAHSVGRACDIFLDATDPLDKKLGDLLFQLFYTNAIYLKVDHAIWNRQIWSHAHPSPGTYNGKGGAHRDHVHVAFRNDHLEVLPYLFSAMCAQLVTQYVAGSDGASDRHDGLYGQAFNPRMPKIRLNHRQRHRTLLKNMGMEGSAL